MELSAHIQAPTALLPRKKILWALLLVWRGNGKKSNTSDVLSINISHSRVRVQFSVRSPDIITDIFHDVSQ